jgi:hypothetical protein
MKTETTKERLQGVDLKRLVGLVKSAVRSQADRMIVSLELYDEDDELQIAPMLRDELDLGNTEEDAVRATVATLFDRHEETMRDAVQEDVNAAKRRALDHLANEKPHATGPAGERP